MSDNKHKLKVLMIDAATGFYRMQRYRVGDFFGPVDIGIHLAYNHNAFTIGAGLLADSVFPGSNRLIIAGISPCWYGFYVSSMGGAALVFDNLGINMISLIGKSPHPSILYLNRNHGEEIEVELVPVVPERIWDQGSKGVYAVMEDAIRMFGPRYEKNPGGSSRPRTGLIRYSLGKCPMPGATRVRSPGTSSFIFTPVTTLRDRCIPDTGFVMWRSPISPMTWDELGRNGIERMVAKSNGWVYYLGGLAKYQDRYDMLKPVVKSISRFFLKHL